MNETSRKSPKILITNDDGIESLLLREMIARLSSKFSIIVAAPAEERSFCGRSFSFQGDICVEKQDEWPCEAYAVDGTPSDCINIALSHLCDDELPDLVLSGPNIGRNTSLGFILGSGTVAGALEGAFWGLPGLALSQGFESNALANQIKGCVELPEYLGPVFERSLDFAESAITRVLNQPRRRLRVDSVNFPYHYAKDALDFREVPAVDFSFGGFFKKTADNHYTSGAGKRVRETAEDVFTDIDCVSAGYPSWTVLDFGSLCLG